MADGHLIFFGWRARWMECSGIGNIPSISRMSASGRFGWIKPYSFGLGDVSYSD